jgi:hydrogenase-1 operon protein HyaF
MVSLPTGPSSIGPGSQPGEEDGSILEYVRMPDDMRVFSLPDLPEPEETEDLAPAKAVMAQISQRLDNYEGDGPENAVDLRGLDAANLAFINQLLGEGEVSIVAGENLQAQESVFAGVWRLRQTAGDGAVVADRVEIGRFPSQISALAFAHAQAEIEMPDAFGENVFNTPALISELNARIPEAGPGRAPHAINLSLLPHSEEDLQLLNGLLGRGDITILSRGYGNCRITATATKFCWWVLYFNSQDTLILNSVEVTPMPEVACAAAEDIADSAERLADIREVYR